MSSAAKALNMSKGIISVICSKIDTTGCKHAMNKENGKFYGFKLNLQNVQLLVVYNRYCFFSG